MQFHSFAIGRPLQESFLDRVEVDRSGVIRLVGWSARKLSSGMIPCVSLESDVIPFLQHYRVARPDVASHVGTAEVDELGLVLEYQVPDQLADRQFTSLSIVLNKVLERTLKGTFRFWRPPYGPLLNTSAVLHRQHIYGSGPPNAEVNLETLALAQKLPSPVLDFGCGSGALVGHLITSGKQAKGIELDTDVISSSISPKLREHIVLYDGRFPAPFPDRSFRAVFCSEVLEHIPEYESAAAEIGRIASEAAIFTVPDASAIAVGAGHGVVPWHLLESTHVNFFNQTSLLKVLSPHFREIAFGRVGLSSFNESPYYVSLVAFCRK